MPDDKLSQATSNDTFPASIGACLYALAEARQNFLRTHGEEISAMAGWLGQANKLVGEWFLRNGPALRVLSGQLYAVLEKLPEWTANLQTHALLLERGLQVLRDEGYCSTGHVFPASEAMDLAALSPDELHRTLHERTTTPEFGRDVLDIYRSSCLRPDRVALLDEALRLHRDGSFAGAVVLLYSQLEGIITDALVELEHAVRKDVASVKATNGHKLRGLHDKLQLADDKLAGATHVFRDLLNDLLAPSDSSSTVSKTRNHVLHGSDTAFATAQRSTQIVLWTFAILAASRAVLPRRGGGV